MEFASGIEPTRRWAPLWRSRRFAARICGAVAFFSIPVFAVGAPLDLVRAAEEHRIKTIDRVAPSVVCVADAQQRSDGAGVLIDAEGYGLTNYHVVAGLLDTRRGWGGLADGVFYPLEVLGIDVTGDVAMFRLVPPQPAFRFPFAQLGDSDAVRVGDTVLAMGNPFSLSEDNTTSVTLGIVTGVHRYQWGVGGNLVYSDCIQVDAPINPGNSGGPLFNASGEVIGINGRISVNTRGRFNVGFGYAITSNQIQRFLPALRAGLLARHGTWQARVVDAEGGAHDAGEDPASSAGGTVTFVDIREPGPVFDAGIRRADLLQCFDGKAVESANHVASLLGTYPAGWPVLLRIARDQAAWNAVVKLEPLEPTMQHPFEVDREINLRQVRRVLQSFRSAVLGGDSDRRPRNWSWTAERRHRPAPDGNLPAPERWAATQSDDGPIRMQHRLDDGSTGRVIEFDSTTATQRFPNDSATYDLPDDIRAVLFAQYVVHRRLVEPDGAMDMTGVMHEGADSLLDPPAPPENAGGPCGGEVHRKLVEIIRWPLASGAIARLAFGADSFLLVRFIVQDPLSGAQTTVELSDYRDIGGVVWPGVLEVQGGGHNYIEKRSHWELSP